MAQVRNKNIGSFLLVVKMLILKSKSVLAVLFGLSCLFVFFSCNSDGGSFGQEFINVKTNIITTDTCTVWSYTIKQDSVVTSGTNEALVGKYYDSGLGDTLTAKTCFEMEVPTIPTDLDPNAVFDNVFLNLRYDRYYYGDTTKSFSLKVYPLDKPIYLNNNGYLYNTSPIPYTDENLLGQTTVIPRPNSYDSLYIDIDQNFGSNLFDLIKNNDDRIKFLKSSDGYGISTYIAGFKGFALVPELSNSCILGFAAADTGIYLGLNYHYTSSDDGSVINKTIKIKMNVTSTHTSSYQFNNIRIGFDNPILHKSKIEDKLSSNNNKNTSFCQAGMGIMTRLEFPYLNQLLSQGNIKILSAQLILGATPKTFLVNPLPANFNLYTIDNLNNLGTSFTKSSALLTGTWSLDDYHNEKTYYTLDITSYITSAIQQTNNLDTPALCVTIAAENTKNKNLLFTFTRAILNDNSDLVNPTKLRILYWRY